MTRRRAVVMASAATIFVIVALLGLGMAIATRTQRGREVLRAQAESFLNRSAKGGKWYIGPISGSLFGDLQVDSFALREPNDSLFISARRVTLRFDPRDLWDRRVVVRSARLEHPVVHVRQDSAGKWNYRKIFPSGPPKARSATLAFGDHIIINDAQLEDAEFHLVMPWKPADSLRGVKRDSAIAHALARPDKDIKRAGSGFVISRHWVDAEVRLPYARIAERDSAGRKFVIDRLGAQGFDPPMTFRNARGEATVIGDSVWVTLPHFELPASVGSVSGKVWWGGNRPTRYDLHVRGESVGLADVAWVYPTLPTEGSGRMNLSITNARDPKVIDYALTNMDVKSTGSRLMGDMTFGVGGPVLEVRDVDLEAKPIDWALIERLTGEPLPYPWKGKITMALRAPGGPVNAFRVEQGTFDFADANVPGATAAGRVRGELNMLFPAFTRFNDFDVELDHFDLATIQFLNPAFPRLDGTLHGRATLDSVWTDVRFRDADITHRFGAEPVSRFTGAGRVTIGEEWLTYDVTAEAQPLELGTIAKAWPELALEYRGTLRGPVRLQGTAEDLDVTATMSGTPGSMAWTGKVDIDSVGGYAYRGTMRFQNANLRVLYDTAAFPVTALNGVAVVDIRGDSLPNYVGTANVDLSRSMIDSVRVYDGGLLRLRFLDGVLRADSAVMESPVGRLWARGGLGLRAGKSDSMQVHLEADSLGGLRGLLARTRQDSTARLLLAADSLKGELTGDLYLTGAVDSLTLRGLLHARALEAMGAGARRARLALDLRNASSDQVRGTVSLTADTASVATLLLRNAAVDVTVEGARQAGVHLLAEATNATMIEARAGVSVVGDSTRVTLASARLGLVDHEIALGSPATIHLLGQGFALEPIVLTGNRGGRIELSGSATDNAPVGLNLRLDAVPLADLATLAQSRVTLAGAVTARLDVGGSRASPTMQLQGRLDGTKVGEVNLARTDFDGTYSNRRFDGALAVLRGDTTVLRARASLPLDLALESRVTRKTNDSLTVSLVSRDVDLALVESFTDAATAAGGRLNADFNVRGTWDKQSYAGYLSVDSARASLVNLGIQVRDVFADIRTQGDTVRLNQFRMVSGASPRNALSLAGWVTIADIDDPAFSFTLSSRDFHVINRPRIANLRMSSDLQFSGRQSASELTGAVTVTEGFIVIPELTSKQIVNVDDPSFSAVIDTSLTGTRAVLGELPELLRGLTVRDVSIRMGDDVRLRSVEANIKLGGEVNVVRASGLSARGIPQLTVDGSLRTERGTFLMRFGDVLLQRLFTIENGSVNFYGDADFNPTLDISALYSVRQYSQLYSNRNVRILLRLQGTLVQPRLTLESADQLSLSESDLIAYLLTGRPSADIGGLNDVGYYGDLVLSNFSSSLSQRLSGRFFDYLQLQSVSGAFGTGSTAAGQRSALAGLSATQLDVGKQLNPRTFVRLTTGFCPLASVLGGPGGSTPTSLGQTIGGSLEYTIRNGLGVSVSREPPLAAMLCGQELVTFVAARGPQTTFDLFKTWRW